MKVVCFQDILYVASEPVIARERKIQKFDSFVNAECREAYVQSRYIAVGVSSVAFVGRVIFRVLTEA